MKRRFLFAAFFVAPSALVAQGLTGKIAELIRFGTCDQALCLVTGGGTHGSHFINSAQTADADLLTFLTNSITSSVSSLPIGSTSSGTTFSFVGGAPVQNKSSAGPIFAERASTLGKGRVLAGVNTTHISFSKLRGISTDSLEINLGHQDVGAEGLGDPAFENDVIGISLNMKLSLQVTTLFATYGLTDKIDVGVAVPFIMTSFEGTGSGAIFNPTGSVSGFHFFGTAESPSLTASSAADGSASGIGDIALRAKVHLAGTNARGLAFLADVRLPTGDEANFQGSGSTSASGILIASATKGNFSHHANVGYALHTGDGQNNAILATLGFDYMLSKAATVAVDLLTQFQSGGMNGTLPPTIPITGHPVSGSNIPDTKDNPMGLSAGGRFLVGNFTLLANGLVPIKSGGLQSKFIWTLGAQRSF